MSEGCRKVGRHRYASGDVKATRQPAGRRLYRGGCAPLADTLRSPCRMQVLLRAARLCQRWNSWHCSMAFCVCVASRPWLFTGRTTEVAPIVTKFSLNVTPPYGPRKRDCWHCAKHPYLRR